MILRCESDDANFHFLTAKRRTFNHSCITIQQESGRKQPPKRSWSDAKTALFTSPQNTSIIPIIECASRCSQVLKKGDKYQLLRVTQKSASPHKPQYKYYPEVYHYEHKQRKLSRTAHRRPLAGYGIQPLNVIRLYEAWGLARYQNRQEKVYPQRYIF